MKNVMKYIKKIFVVISVIWTTVTLGFIGIMALSGPAHCPVDTSDKENQSNIQNTNVTVHTSLQERDVEVITPNSLYLPSSIDTKPGQT